MQIVDLRGRDRAWAFGIVVFSPKQVELAKDVAGFLTLTFSAENIKVRVSNKAEKVDNLDYFCKSG